MAKVLQLDKTDPPIDADLKEFIDACLVPILVRNALKEIQGAEPDADLESIPLYRVRCASGGSK